MRSLIGMTEAKAAEMLGVSEATLKRWRRMGAVGYRMLPSGGVRYSEEDLHRLIASMKVEPQLGKKL